MKPENTFEEDEEISQRFNNEIALEQEPVPDFQRGRASPSSEKLTGSASNCQEKSSHRSFSEGVGILTASVGLTLGTQEDAIKMINNREAKMIKHYLQKNERKPVSSICRGVVEDKTEDGSDVVSPTIPPSNNRINLKMIKNVVIHTQEFDNLFLEDMEKVFFKAWRQVNIGEFVMQAYIDICTHKGELDPLFFSAANLQFL